jgi:hypothetical protein
MLALYPAGSVAGARLTPGSHIGTTRRPNASVPLREPDAVGSCVADVTQFGVMLFGVGYPMRMDVVPG